MTNPRYTLATVTSNADDAIELKLRKQALNKKKITDEEIFRKGIEMIEAIEEQE